MRLFRNIVAYTLWTLLGLVFSANLIFAAPSVILTGPWGKEAGQFGRTHPDEQPVGPMTFTVGMSGEIFVLDNLNGRIQRFSRVGKFVEQYKIPAGDPVGFIAVPAYDMDNNGKKYIQPPVFVANYGSQCGQVKNGTIEWYQPIVPPGELTQFIRFKVDSKLQWFIEQLTGNEHYSSVMLFDKMRRYVGHRDISQCCINAATGDLIGVAVNSYVDQLSSRQMVISRFSAVNLYEEQSRCTVNIAAGKDDFVELVGVAVDRDSASDQDCLLYILITKWDDLPSSPVTYRVLLFSADGKPRGALSLDDIWKPDNMYYESPARQIVIDAGGNVYISASSAKEGYSIVMYPNKDFH
ncbi:MAG: hypothetical protein WC074_09270 [bacterium]